MNNSKSNKGKPHGGKQDRAKPDAKPKSEQTPSRTAVSELPSDAPLTMLILKPQNNWTKWQNDNELYFATKYGEYGTFFGTMKEYEIPAAIRPRIRGIIGGERRPSPKARGRKRTNVNATATSIPSNEATSSHVPSSTNVRTAPKHLTKNGERF